MSKQDRPLLKYWDRLCALQPYSFFLSSPPGVKRVPDKTGNWIERHRAQEIVDSAEAEISELRSALNAMLTHMGMDEDEWNKPTFDQARAALAAAPAQDPSQLGGFSAVVTLAAPQPALSAGWVSVDERLPEPNVEVLCAGRGWGNSFVTACYYDDERREWYPINTHWTYPTGCAQYPTHWMKLPEPPNGKN